MSKPRPQIEEGERAMRRFVQMATKQETKEVIPVLRKKVMEKCNELKHCPFCSQKIQDVTTTFPIETTRDTIRIVLNWCQAKGKHEFQTGDVKHLLSHTQYANLNHLVKFGGVVYRPMNPKTGRRYTSTYYGLNIERAIEFLGGEIAVPIQVKNNRFTQLRTGEVSGTVNDLPHVNDLLDEEGRYQQPVMIPE